MEANIFKGSKILLVEDEESLAVGLEYNLKEEGCHVTWAKDGQQALNEFAVHEFDLIILDLMLPYYNGFDVAQRVREKSPQLPILILTARTAAIDRVRGLELGADDYLTKPFHLPELLLRIKGMLRRKQWYRDTSTIQGIYQFGKNSINFDNLTAQTTNQTFKLTPYEAMVLKYLIENKDKIVTRQELLAQVWNIHSPVETRTVDNFILRLRKYFEPDPAQPIFIKSVRSAGYSFSTPDGK